MTLPPKPPSRSEHVGLWRYMRLFRQDILSAQPEKLYRAWMAEFKTPFFRSFLVNDPDVIKTVLKDRPDDFPKSDRVGDGLRPLLGNSVFLTNGDVWKKQRRIIDPAFEGGRLRHVFPAMWDAGEAAVERLLRGGIDGPVDVEPFMSHLAADVIFRTLFSMPIDHQLATRVFDAFRMHQRTQPILNLAAFVRGPRWMPKFFRADTKKTALEIRQLIAELVDIRLAEINAGTAPDDLATKIITTVDPQTEARFTKDEMIDQVAIFFLAGHETSAAALSWTLYLLATHPAWQDVVASEAVEICGKFEDLSKLKVTRDVFREALRLYPPVPMMVRQARRKEGFRNRVVPRGAQIVLSPWHLHRQNRLWENPDGFDPSRWESENGKACSRTAYMPFSAGPRVCTGAGFAMMEGVLMTAILMRNFRVHPAPGSRPVPVAHLTVRSKSGIHLRIEPR